MSVLFVDQMRPMRDKERFISDTRCHHYLMKSVAKGLNGYSERTIVQIIQFLTVYVLKTYL